MTYLIRPSWHVGVRTQRLHPMVWSLMHVTYHMTILQYPTSVCSRGGDAACTIALPIMVLAFALCCRSYCLACLVNLCTLVSSSNLSHFWLMWGLILTVWVLSRNCRSATSKLLMTSIHLRAIKGFMESLMNSMVLTSGEVQGLSQNSASKQTQWMVSTGSRL